MDILREGQIASIFFPKDDGKLVEVACNIAKIEDDRLILNLPPYFMRYINYLEQGKRITVKVFSKLGTIDFNAVIIHSPLEEDFTIELDYNAQKLTPGAEIPVVSAMEKLTIIKGENVFNQKTFEISTEYLKFYGQKVFSVDEEYNCKLILPKNYGTISFKGIITEIDPVYDNEFTMAYSMMTEDDRQTLLYYMYVYDNTMGSERV